jgi:hypothetical protein
LKPQNRTAVSVVISVALFIVLSLIVSMTVANVVFVGVGSVFAQTTSSDAKSSETSTEKFSASSIQIEPPDPGDVPMPPEFRMAIYENLIIQIEKTKKFQHVYRSGDKDAASATDLVTLHTTARAFNKGSQRKREVTTVTGSTSMTLNVHITDHAGKTLIDQDVKGKVRFMGENLRATYDFSKKVAVIIKDRF